MQYRIFAVTAILLATFIYFYKSKPSSTTTANSVYENSSYSQPTQSSQNSNVPPQLAQDSSAANAVDPLSSFPRRFPSLEQRGPAAKEPKPERRLQALKLSHGLWQQWLGVTVIPISKFKGQEQDVIEKWNGYVLLPSSGQDVNESTETRFYKDHPLVLFDQRLHTMGIMTGRIIIHSDNQNAIQQISDRHNLNLEQSYPHLSSYFLSSKNSVFDLQATIESIRSESQVRAVEPEIVSRKYEKR